MCLTVTRRKHNEAAAKLPDNKPIKCYKVYAINRTFKNLRSVFFPDEYNVIQHGIIKSNRRRKGWSKKNGDGFCPLSAQFWCCWWQKSLSFQGEWEINRGIHVYLTRQRAQQFLLGIIVPVWCDKKDLVATDGNQAVFMKIKLNRSAVRRAMAS